MDLMNYGLKEKYDQFKKYGDRLSDMKNIIDWNSVRPLLNDLYTNNTENGGRPNYDPVLMVKILFLQSVYGIVDESVEIQMHNRLDFMNFLDFPEYIPDARTVWYFRERLSVTGKDKTIWKDIWKQFKDKGIKIGKGTIQDATFVESDPGHNENRDKGIPEKLGNLGNITVKDDDNSNKSKKEIKEMEKKKAIEKKNDIIIGRINSKTRRSKDGTFTKKNNKTHFGYKLHTLNSSSNDLIINCATTTASLHDSNIDLSIPGIVCYRDKGYFGASIRGIDGTMDKAFRNNKLPVESIRRNLRITKKRSRGERPYYVMKNIFNGVHVYVTTVIRVRVKNTFMCLAHNLLILVKMEKKGLIA